MSETHVRTREELIAASGCPVVTHGRYEARARPIRSTLTRPHPADRAVIVLADGFAVWLEPLDAPASLRPAAERERLDGEAVTVRGIAHEVMPAVGQSPLASCLSDVHDVEEDS